MLLHTKILQKCMRIHKMDMLLTAGQPYAIKSLSSVIIAEMPPLSSSRLDRYANCASASYGATKNSTLSNLSI